MKGCSFTRTSKMNFSHDHVGSSGSYAGSSLENQILNTDDPFPNTNRSLPPQYPGPFNRRYQENVSTKYFAVDDVVCAGRRDNTVVPLELHCSEILTVYNSFSIIHILSALDIHVLQGALLAACSSLYRYPGLYCGKQIRAQASTALMDPISDSAVPRCNKTEPQCVQTDTRQTCLLSFSWIWWRYASSSIQSQIVASVSGNA